MSLLITEKELLAIREAKNLNTQQGSLWRALRARTYKNTEEATLVQSSDTQTYWHLAWERIRDAASVYKIEPNEGLGIWLHDRVMELLNLPADEWIGPAFRIRLDPPRGALETSHLTNAVVEAFDLCPELFSKEEREHMLSVMRERSIKFIREYILLWKKSNWYCIMLGGFASAAVTLGDKELIDEAVGYYDWAMQFYDEDGYGESLQYGNYASIGLMRAYNVLTRYDGSLTDRLNINCIANTVRWTASSLLYMKPLGGERGGVLYPRSLNFGDSAAIFRPTADILLAISSLCPDATVAGLARWIFDKTYERPEEGPDELASFGFYNHFSYESLIYLQTAKAPISPIEAKMPLMNVYKTGTATIRDSWDDNAAILGMQIGYDTHHVNGHRHADHNSFILAYDKERYFADPGHCCYRLKTQAECRTTEHHNTWDFYDEDGNRYTQSPSEADIAPLNTLTSVKEEGNFKIVASDCAKAYGEHFVRAERAFVTALPHVCFIVDRIETDIPMKMVSHFVLNNRDGKLRSKVVDSARIVYRRAESGIKFFTFCDDDSFKLERRYGYIHDNYHPLHNKLGQGKEGTAEIFDFVSDSYSTSHIFVHPLVLQETNEVPFWHIRHKEPYVYMVQNRGNAHSWVLRIHPDKDEWLSVSEE